MRPASCASQNPRRRHVLSRRVQRGAFLAGIALALGACFIPAKPDAERASDTTPIVAHQTSTRGHGPDVEAARRARSAVALPDDSTYFQRRVTVLLHDSGYIRVPAIQESSGVFAARYRTGAMTREAAAKALVGVVEAYVRAHPAAVEAARHPQPAPHATWILALQHPGPTYGYRAADLLLQHGYFTIPPLRDFSEAYGRAILQQSGDPEELSHQMLTILQAYARAHPADIVAAESAAVARGWRR